MMDTYSRETPIFAFLLLSAAFPLICSQTVRGTEGQSVTLPCSYKVKRTSDITHMCWGRGSCPNSKCNEVLIWTNGYTVIQRPSNRYQLNDNIPGGKVSLTISQASMSDDGTYCCRIEHSGWFNDEKTNIRLIMEKAPTTTPPTTTRRTTPGRTHPSVRKTTLPLTTVLPTTVRTTTPLPTLEITSMPSPTPAITTITVPTDEENIETTKVVIVQRTTPAGSSLEPDETTTPPSPPLSTVTHITSPYTTNMDETTTPAQPTSTDSHVIRDFSPEMNHSHEENDPHHEKGTIPSQHGSHSNQDGISDLFSGNVSTVVKKESGLDLHIIITAICVSVIVLVVVSLLIITFKGKERGRYLLGLDPNLELVSHAEDPLPETDVEISQTVTLEVDKMEADKRKF